MGKRRKKYKKAIGFGPLTEFMKTAFHLGRDKACIKAEGRSISWVQEEELYKLCALKPEVAPNLHDFKFCYKLEAETVFSSHSETLQRLFEAEVGLDLNPISKRF